jgi:hypothetical protein
MARKWAENYYVVFILVVFGHVVLLVLLWHLEFVMRPRAEDAVSVVLLDLRAPTNSSSAAPVALTHIARSPPSTPKKAPLKLNENTNGNLSATAPQIRPAESITDWQGEAEHVANSQAPLILKDLKHDCDEAALRGEHPPGCRKYKKPDAWRPEPKKFGIAGGLPYVRLGKRCVLGLGFFGCAVGKLPEADGKVFDDARDPDRPWSSVPNSNQ